MAWRSENGFTCRERFKLARLVFDAKGAEVGDMYILAFG